MNSHLDQAPCIYFSTSDDGTLLEVNRFLCGCLLYEPEELLGKKVQILFTVATQIFQQTHFYPLLKMQGHAEEIFITLQKRDGGTLPVLVNAERKEMDGNIIHLYIGIIVHNRKKFEEELITAKKTAEAALNENTALIRAKQELQTHGEELDRQIHLVRKQNDELRQFNHVVTHEMQEPLRKLLLFSSLLLEGDGHTDSKKLVDKISRVSQQMSVVLKGLQQYIWLHETPLQKARIDLNDLISGTLFKLEKEFPEMEIFANKNELEYIEADPQQMQVLFYQLISNAVRFRKDEKKVFITIGYKKLRLNRFRHVEGKYQFVDFARIQVGDKGIGFDPAYEQQVFQLFKKLDTNSGPGVGLSLCKTIVDNHFGSISIQSMPGEGTTVTVDLPLA